MRSKGIKATKEKSKYFEHLQILTIYESVLTQNGRNYFKSYGNKQCMFIIHKNLTTQK